MHPIFIVLHLIALLVFPLALWVTIPLHVIGTVVNKPPDPNRPTPSTHVKCPDCAELVRKEARVCKHCGCKLTPQA